MAAPVGVAVTEDEPETGGLSGTVDKHAHIILPIFLHVLFLFSPPTGFHTDSATAHTSIHFSNAKSESGAKNTLIPSLSPPYRRRSG